MSARPLRMMPAALHLEQEDALLYWKGGAGTEWGGRLLLWRGAAHILWINTRFLHGLLLRLLYPGGKKAL